MKTTEAPRDRIFAQEAEAFDFTFNAEVATVFDDMVSRSVPYYGEMQRMMKSCVKSLKNMLVNWIYHTT